MTELHRSLVGADFGSFNLGDYPTNFRAEFLEQLAIAEAMSLGRSALLPNIEIIYEGSEQ